jgi:hypothetical protein
MTPSSMERGDAESTLGVVRRALLWLLVGSLLGVGVELVLLGHYEDVWQWAPIALIVLAAGILVWHLVSRRGAGLRPLRWLMWVFIVSGVVGTWLHYRGNVEFELEMYPSMAGLELFREAMTGATPSLAPGTMILLGAIGLLYSFRHPALSRAADGQHTS